MNEERLTKLINDFNPKNLTLFLRDKCINYAEAPQSLSQYDGDKFSGFSKHGEIKFENSDRLVVVTAQVGSDLSERSGKKAQYDKAKKILKELMVYNAGFFIYYDNSGNFRFSLVYAQYEGTKVNFNNFRRFTYFVDTQQTNNTFKLRVGGCDFTSLEKIKDAFSVEKVNKEFYAEIAKYYYRLTDKAKKELVLPSVGENAGSKYEEFSVRLIGRIIFCWFLKHKTSADKIPLISKDVLSSDAVDDKKEYYHLILEKLFFEVMNKQQDKRTNDIDLYIPNHKQIPFLNGGLFEAHNNDFYKGTVNNNLKISPLWFKEFFELLERYNFTIDENSTVDAEVSVDPEMLGRIFENLLAEIVPETGETARKATGSYYTPRVIVDYMVEQSLKQYLITKTSLSEDIIDSLLSYEVDTVDITDAEKTAIVKALKEIKVIDPACGSGAFPMGILHRILLVLEKADHDLAIWRKLYLNAYHPVMRKIIEDKLSKGNEQYIRKLTIIQDSIYGVDIQPIAVEIAKLRCFLSLVVDELVFDNEDNRGIEALPNLEFKFVAANTLIGLPPIASQSAFGVTDLIEKLKDLRERYLRSFGAEKLQIEKEFKDTQQKLYKENVQWALTNDTAKQLSEWDPFSYESCTWFEREWMFGIEDGFDIVIGNPPYVSTEKLCEPEKGLYSKLYHIVHRSRTDIYCYFYYRGLEITRENTGILCYITSNKWMRAAYGEGLRNYFLTKNPRILIDLGPNVFEKATVDTNIMLIQNNSSSHHLYGLTLNVADKGTDLTEYIQTHATELPPMTANAWFIGSNTEQKLKEKIAKLGKPLKDWDVIISYGIKTGLNEAFIIDTATKDCLCREDPKSEELLKPILRGRDIKRYSYNWAGLWVIVAKYISHKEIPKIYPAIYRHLCKFEEELKKRGQCQYSRGYRANNAYDYPGQHHWLELDNNPKLEYLYEFEKEKLVWQEIAQEPTYSYDIDGMFCNDTGRILTGNNIKYMLGFFNSYFFRYTFSHYYAGGALGERGIRFKSEFMKEYPIPPITSQNEQIIKEIESIVTQIIDIKKVDFRKDTLKLEREIDELVYKLYDLTPEEIAIVEGNGEKSHSES